MNYNLWSYRNIFESIIYYKKLICGAFVYERIFFFCLNSLYINVFSRRALCPSNTFLTCKNTHTLRNSANKNVLRCKNCWTVNFFYFMLFFLNVIKSLLISFYKYKNSWYTTPLWPWNPLWHLSCRLYPKTFWCW